MKNRLQKKKGIGKHVTLENASAEDLLAALVDKVPKEHRGCLFIDRLWQTRGTDVVYRLHTANDTFVIKSTPVKEAKLW